MKLPRTAREDIAWKVVIGTPVRELAREYGVCTDTIYQLLQRQGVRLTPHGKSPAEQWIEDRVRVYPDPDTRDWLGAQLRTFLERWHEKEG